PCAGAVADRQRSVHEVASREVVIGCAERTLLRSDCVAPRQGRTDGSAGVRSAAAHDGYGITACSHEPGNRHCEGGKRITIVSLRLVIGRHCQVRLGDGERAVCWGYIVVRIGTERDRDRISTYTRALRRRSR